MQLESTAAQISKSASFQLKSLEHKTCPCVRHTRETVSNLVSNGSDESICTKSSQCQHGRVVFAGTDQNRSNATWFQYLFGNTSYHSWIGKPIPKDFKSQQRALFIARYQAPKLLFNLAIEAQVCRQRSAWNIQIRTYNFVPWESPVFAFARENNLEGLRELLRRRKASPYDKDSKWGQTALHVNFPLRRITIHSG